MNKTLAYSNSRLKAHLLSTDSINKFTLDVEPDYSVKQHFKLFDQPM